MALKAATSARVATRNPVPFVSRATFVNREVARVNAVSRVVRPVLAQAAPAEAATTTKKVNTSPVAQPAPAKYAVIEIGGHQMFVEPGKWYTCNRLQAEAGSRVKFGRVLLFKDGDSLQVGKPYLENINIEAEIMGQERGPKVIVYKMKPKKHYRRKNGHRQELTRFLVTGISAQ